MSTFFSPVDAVVLGSNNHTLAVLGPEFSCAFLQMTTLGRQFRVLFSFFPLQSIWVSGFFFLQSKWYLSHEAVRVTHLLTLWHSPWLFAGAWEAISCAQAGCVSG